MGARESGGRAALAYVGNDAGYFVSHRLTLARAAVDAGYQVDAILPGPVGDSTCAELDNADIRIHEIRFQRGGMHPLREFKTLIALWSAYRRLRPAIVHHLTVKPVLYGGLVGRVLGVPNRVHALLGLGYLFFDDSLRARVVRWLLKPAFRFALGGKGSRILVQNPDDLNTLRGRGIISAKQMRRALVIPGSGAEPSDYDPTAQPRNPPIVLFAGRLTAAKGVQVFVDAARELCSAGVQARFVVCGGIDVSNPGHIRENEMQAWVAENVIEWWGHRDDMVQMLESASLVVLPSIYGEGIPKILIEAAAASRPIVTTNTPGCREIVRHGENGLLVAADDAPALATAIDQLLKSSDQRQKMGLRGREMVEEKFSIDHIIRKTLDVYAEAAGQAA